MSWMYDLSWYDKRSLSVRGAGDAGIKGTNHPSYGLLQFHVHAFRCDIAFSRHLQGPFNGQHVVHRGNDELFLCDETVLNTVTVDQGTTWGLN